MKTLFYRFFKRSALVLSSITLPSPALSSIVLLIAFIFFHSISFAGTVVLKRTTTPSSMWGGMHINTMNLIIAPLRLDDYLKTNKIKGLYKDNSTLVKAEQAYESVVTQRFALAATTGISMSRAENGPFAWNLIEPEKGVYHFEFPDITVKAAQANGIALIATIYPFASWDHPNSTPATNSPQDFIWWDYITEFPNDLSEYKNFVRALVDRYNGDGINDMAGLTQPIKFYEIGNEPESGGFDSAFNHDGSKYFTIVKATYEAIKEVCPDCRVTNGGALSPQNTTIKTFWQTFASLGGLNYLDYFNWHYNTDRSTGTASSNAISYEDTIAFWKGIESQYGKSLPKLITEIGTYTGKPQNMPDQSEAYQAAYYVKKFTMGLANGVTVLFTDLAESWTLPDGSVSVIGSSAMFDGNDTAKKHLYVDSLSTMAGLVNGFTKVEALSSGQYLFTTSGKRVLIAWGSGGITALKGNVRVVDLYGNEQITVAANVTLGDNPLFIVEGGDIVPGITANGSADPVAVKLTQPVSITVSLDTGAYAGTPADWWLAQYNTSGWSYYVYPGLWKTATASSDFAPGYQGNLSNLSPVELMKTTLPEGQYIFYFGVDTAMNGKLDVNNLRYKSVTVNVTK
ncbi:MAG: beta-galactosidase [Nitrospirae bacterium]|nr:beta-galactosidase [Nitrospirota bacterium]